MNFNLSYHDVLFACALFIVTALVSWVALKHLIPRLIDSQIVDIPNERSSHVGVVPRGGGLVIVLFLLLSIFVQYFFVVDGLFFLALAHIVFAWSLLSWFDDKHDLSALVRMATQILIAVLTVFCFGWVREVAGISLGWLALPITVIGLVWIANLYNFMDGIDGFVACQTIVAGLSLMAWFYFLENQQLALICLVLVASTYAFLLWNWNPAKVFMGDVGSISLGGFFGTLIIIGVTRFDLPVLSFVILFAVFIFDATFTVLRRMVMREKVWQAHRQHAYQRYTRLGYSHAQVTLAGLILMVICSCLATLSVFQRDMILWFLVAIFLSLSLLHFLLVYLEQKHSNHDSSPEKQ